jgi:hypothetical protein
MRGLSLIVVFCVACAVSAVRADTIVLKNGNVLEGDIVAENERVVVVRMPSGNATFPRRQIQEIRRERRSSGKTTNAKPGLKLRRVPSGAVSERVDAVYLRDGRRILGRTVARLGVRFVIKTSLGRVAYPDWMIDRSGAIEEMWRFLRELTEADDPPLIRELTRRREALAVRYRGLNDELRALRTEKENDLEKLRSDGDVKGLREFAVNVVALERKFPVYERNRLRDLAVTAIRHALDVEKRAGTTAPPLRLAEAFFEMHRVKLSPNYRETARYEMRKTIGPFFLSDPGTWGTGLDFVDRVEGFDWWSQFAVNSEDKWRRDFRKTSWHGPPYPKKVRVVRVGGGEVIGPERPSTRDGIESVWIPSTRSGGVVAIMEGAGAISSKKPCWYRIFWCPVDRAWKKGTTSEVLAESLVAVVSHLGRQMHQERIEANGVAYRLKQYNSAVDSLARSYLDPVKGALRRGHEREFERANLALAKLLELNRKSLGRRANLGGALARFHELRKLLDKVNSGERVDIDAVREPPSVTWIQPDAAVLEVELRVVASLQGWDPEGRLETLRSKPIRTLGSSNAIETLVRGIATNDFTLLDQRRAAQELLDDWKIAASAIAEELTKS